MAKHKGRGIATIEYPTGMNQNGDPSQAWIKVKPDGRIDVFAGTVDVGQGSKTVHTQIVADTIGVPYDWVTMDVSNTDSSPICTGSFASRGTFIGGNAVRFAAERVREKILEIASKEMEIDPGDLEIADGEVLARGAPDRKLGLEISNDMDLGFMRWLTVSVPGDPGREILLEKPGPPAMDEATAAQVRELVAKGAMGFAVGFTTSDCRKTYETLKARDVEFTQEPTEQPYGIDAGFRDPAGNHFRVAQQSG